MKVIEDRSGQINIDIFVPDNLSDVYFLSMGSTHILKENIIQLIGDFSVLGNTEGWNVVFDEVDPPA